MYFAAQESESRSTSTRHWFRRFGLVGFLFFFLKGMLWLIIPWIAHSVFL